MTENSIYTELARRTGGACMLGVVGPVRTGKSTFIKRFMETLVIPRIRDEYQRQRARDELPQSGSGRSIMTAEPKFVPEEAVSVSLGPESSLAVRLVDCVGYMVPGAAGALEDDRERLVTTPWFDHEVTMTQAAEQGTELVIRQHADVGVVVTTDGSVCDLPREAYEEAEGRVIRELQEIGKPFVVLLNSTDPAGEGTADLAGEIGRRYGVRCLPVNCLTMDEAALVEILRFALEEFPLCSLGITLPGWVRALEDADPLKKELYGLIRSAGQGARVLRDLEGVYDRLRESELVEALQLNGEDLGRGTASVSLELPRELYYRLLSERSGVSIRGEGDLMAAFCEMSAAKKSYDHLREAWEQVCRTGYGVVMPEPGQMRLEEPQIVRTGGKYGVRLRAQAPAVHMLRTDVACEVNPALGGDSASEDILGFLLQGFDGDVNRIWESNIFGKSLNELAEESLTERVQSLPPKARERLRETLQRLVNEDSRGLICILL